MWLSNHHTSRVSSRAQHCPSAWETAFDHPLPNRPTPAPCPFLCSFLLLQTNRVLKKGFIGLNAPSDPGGRLPPWHAQVSSSRPSTGLSATRVQPSLGLNCGEEWKQSRNRGTEEEEPRNWGKETWRMRRSEEKEESSAWTTDELQRLALRNRLVHHLAGVSSRNRTPSWQTGSFLIVSSCLRVL